MHNLQDIEAAEAELIGEFSLFDNWMDRYQYIIDMGRRLPDFPDALKADEYRIKGCQSQVWLVTECADHRLRFQAISDSAIVSGLIAVLMRVYNDREAAVIAAKAPDFIAALGLDQHLSPTRSNGLHAMIGEIKAAARRCVAADES